jgi:hypothetical protein
MDNQCPMQDRFVARRAYGPHAPGPFELPSTSSFATFSASVRIEPSVRSSLTALAAPWWRIAVRFRFVSRFRVPLPNMRAGRMTAPGFPPQVGYPLPARRHRSGTHFRRPAAGRVPTPAPVVRRARRVIASTP